MPYIKQDQRDGLDYRIDLLAGLITSDGQLNYVISRLVARRFGAIGWSYDLIARAVGALECVKLEFYRRLAAPYEEQAISRNGDIREYK